MLTGYIRGQELRISTPEIAADSIKYLEAEFHFAGRDWDGYVKTAYFINGTSKFALVLADDRITADMGLNLTAGEWEVKLNGVKGDSRITTTTEHVYVREFGSTDGTLPDVTATQAEQILAKIGDLSNLTTEDKTNLVAAINEAAKSGGGSGGKDGTGIESITYKGEDASGGNMYTVLLTDGTSYDITAPKGAAGADGVTPHIGDNGNWYLGTTDTGKPSRGETGPQGPAGAKGDKGDPGKDGSDATVTAANIAGALGYTPAAPGDIPVVPAAEISANTAARHTHANKAIIDGITGQVTANKINAPDHTTDLVQYGAFQIAARQIISQIPTVPATLPNPNALTVKIGSTTVTYDGSSAQTVEIADGTEVEY